MFEKSIGAVEAIAAIADPAERAQALDDYKRRYVSKKGRDTPAARCPMVAFAGDVSRQSPAVRGEYAAGLHKYLDAFASAPPRPARRAACERTPGCQAITQLAALAGALTLARSVANADPVLSDEIPGSRRRRARFDGGVIRRVCRRRAFEA